MRNLTHDIYPVLSAHAEDLAGGEWLIYYYDDMLYLKVGSDAPFALIADALQETAQAEIQNETSTEADKYVSVRRFWQGIARFLGLANVWTALQSFSAITTKQAYTSKQTFVLTGANPSQAINLDNGSHIVLDLTAASGTATITFSNPKSGASYWIEVLQASTAVNLSIANVGRYDGGTGATITGTNSVNLDIIALWNGSGMKLNIVRVS